MINRQSYKLSVFSTWEILQCHTLLSCRLTEILELVLYEYGTGLPQLTELEFPASIKLNQAVAAWKHIVRYYDAQDVDQQKVP
jgi:hypothetical protein